MSPDISIDPMAAGDWKRVKAIYAEGLATGIAAFRQTPPLWKDWHAGHLTVGRLVARSEGEIFGWAALAPVADS